jgi:intergrase/recombinase
LARFKGRINEIRDYFGTPLRKHNMTKDERDLLQGRVPSEIFIRHYCSPILSELRDRICARLVDYYRITLNRGADTYNLVVEYGSVYMRNR